MVNMLVQWRGPNSALATLAKELNARFGNPTRFYEYVTGYKSPSNVSGHNADNNGIGHSMDIFVGAGHNISVEQGIDLAERLRLEGKKGSIPGHPDRLAYIIHRGRIAGDHTNWEWVAYNGIADHYDHIHISSVFDYYWGDVVAGHPLDYNSTAAWNLWTVTTGLGSKPTPIPEEKDWLDVASKEDVQLAVWSYKNPKEGPDAWAYLSGVYRNSVKIQGELAAVKEIVQQIAKGAGTPLDLTAVEAAAKRGAEAALSEGVGVNVTVGGTK